MTKPFTCKALYETFGGPDKVPIIARMPDGQIKEVTVGEFWSAWYKHNEAEWENVFNDQDASNPD